MQTAGFESTDLPRLISSEPRETVTVNVSPSMPSS
jgi:hypothetical protein